CFLLLRRRAPRPTLFPYTTLFRSLAAGIAGGAQLAPALVPVYRLHIAVIPTYRFERMAQLLQLAALVGTERGVLDLDVVGQVLRSEEHTSELQSRENLVCRLLLEK